MDLLAKRDKLVKSIEDDELAYISFETDILIVFIRGESAYASGFFNDWEDGHRYIECLIGKYKVFFAIPPKGYIGKSISYEVIQAVGTEEIDKETTYSVVMRESNTPSATTTES